MLEPMLPLTFKSAQGLLHIETMVSAIAAGFWFALRMISLGIGMTIANAVTFFLTVVIIIVKLYYG